MRFSCTHGVKKSVNERQKKVKYKCERDEKKVIDIESHFASI